MRWGAIGLLLLCSSSSVANFYWDAQYDKEDVKTAVAYINKRDLEASRIISVGQIDSAVKYYGPDQATYLTVMRAVNCESPGHI